MKKLLLILFILLWGGVNLAQNKSTSGEFNVTTRNNDGETVTVTMQLIGGACWFAIDAQPDLHEPTSAYPGTSQETDDNNQELAWEACWEEYEPGVFLSYPIGLGKYKITAKVNGVPKDYFWVDWRNDQLSEHFGDALIMEDINVDFDLATEKFYWDLSTNDLINQASVTWGQRAGWITTTSKLIPYPADNFNMTTYNNHPKLTWNHSSEYDYWTGYAVYRAMMGYLESPDPEDFRKIATVGKYTTSYVDTDLDLGSYGTAYYKITAINGTKESEFSFMKIQHYAPPKQGSGEDKQYTFNLSQNYPNPFNPSTKISYSIPSEEFVTLKVYNILGKVVAELVNKKHSAGEYSVSFNGENLPSGIYIYKIAAGQYNNTRKLLLVK